MKRHFLLIAAGFYLVFCMAYQTPGIAAEPIVLILGEDWDKDSIPRKNQAFDRILRAVSSKLRHEGIRVLDEALVMQKNFIRGRVRRTKEEVFQIAKGVKTPMIDAVASLKISWRIKATAGKILIDTQFTGNIINASTGDDIGNFYETFSLPTEKSCAVHRDCVMTTIGDPVHELGQKVGAVIANHLRRAMVVSRPDGEETGTRSSDPTILRAYKITFDNFGSTDFNHAEEFMVAFSGYHRHEIILAMMRRFEITYETRSEDAKLKRNLRKMVAYMGIDASVKCIKNTCTISKL
jgi:hypothetical protein